MKKNLIYKFRVNASGSVFYSAKVMNLEDIRGYSHSTSNAKSIRGAIKALNDDGYRRYQNCMMQQVWYADAGKVDVVPDEQNFDVTCTSRKALITSVAIHLGDDAAKQLESYLS